MWELQAEQKSRKVVMAEGEERIELKFRIYDGTDIGHSTYASSMTVGTLKQRLVTEWPKGYLSFDVFFTCYNQAL